MKRKHDVMRYLASYVRSKNAVVTAMLAVLAVVLVSTAVPVDKISAGIHPDPSAEVMARANAWWSVLTDDQRLRVGVGTSGLDTISDARKATLLDGTDSVFRGLVDGVPADVYGVGDHIPIAGGLTANSYAIRGFQSVDLWWAHMDCQEKNLATGTDNVATTNGEGYCQDYDALDAESLEHVNKVGMAINSLDEPGEASDAHIQAAADWYNILGSFGRGSVIYGTGFDSHQYSTGTISYSQVDADFRTLVNDRWKYVYDEGGNDIEAWWNKLNCTQRFIVVGRNSTPDAGDHTSDPFCSNATYNALVDFVAEDNDDPDIANTSRTRGYSDLLRRATVLLGLSPIPDVAAWWDWLSDEEKVNVIWGDPPTKYSVSSKEVILSFDVGELAQVQKPYSELTGGINFGNAFGEVFETTQLSHTMETLLNRQQAREDWCSVEMKFRDPLEFPACTADQIAYTSIIEHIVEDIWDPPRPGVEDGGDTRLDSFDPPYTAVYQWWQQKDCRSKRLALGEDHMDLDLAVEDDPLTTDTNEEKPAETSEYCKLYPGDPAAMGDSTQWLSYNAYRRVHEVARVLRVRLDDEIVRPPFNGYPSGEVLVHGPAVVGEAMMADISGVTDPEGIPEDGVTYQWLRDGTPIPGATGSSYVLTTADAGAIISVNVSYTDLAYIRETISGRAGSQISVGAVSGGGISRIEPGIRSVTVSAGDEVVLQVNIYGLQGAQDQSLGNGVMFNWMQDGNSIDGMSSSLTYTAPSSPGAYRVVASLDEEDCRPADRADFETDCSAEFEVRVRRPAAPQPAAEPPVNPPGEIPTILTDSQGAQYEVFTPVEGGTFDAGEGYSIMAPSGAVPNGEYIGVRMSDDGMASNAGVTSHRYTLGGNMYGIHAVDSTGASVTDYVLEDPARVCVPLPDVLRAQISDLALVTINSDNTLTILAANVRLGTSGTSVCGNLSNLPASVAVGSFGAPDAIPTATPEPTPIPPETGASSPTSNSAVWALLLGIAVLILGSFIILGRRRGNIRA